MPVQDEIGRRGAGEQRGDFSEVFPHFAGQGWGLHLERGVVVTVDDFAETDGASEHFGEHERIERQQQLVVLGELVPINETEGHELRRLAPAGGRDAFNGVEARFNRSSRREEALTDFRFPISDFRFLIFQFEPRFRGCCQTRCAPVFPEQVAISPSSGFQRKY